MGGSRCPREGKKRMPRGRVSGSGRKPRRASQVKFHRFLGLSLSGGKSDRSCLTVIDFYPDSKRLFLSGITDRIRSEEFISADLKLHELISQFSDNCRWLGFDVPLNIPICIRCQLACPGFETCSVEEIKWMRGIYQNIKKKKPKKMFTPYTQRGVDLFLQELEDDNLEIQQALGANLAPLTARAHFIQRRLDLPSFEVATKVSVLRMGLKLHVSKSHLLNYRSTTSGEEARRVFLQALCDKTGLFIYQQDLKSLIDSYHAFDALICAFIGYLHFQEKTEAPPSDFPKSAGWSWFPKNIGIF